MHQYNSNKTLKPSRRKFDSLYEDRRKWCEENTTKGSTAICRAPLENSFRGSGIVSTHVESVRADLAEVCIARVSTQGAKLNPCQVSPDPRARSQDCLVQHQICAEHVRIFQHLWYGLTAFFFLWLLPCITYTDVFKITRLCQLYHVTNIKTCVLSKLREVVFHVLCGGEVWAEGCFSFCGSAGEISLVSVTFCCVFWWTIDAEQHFNLCISWFLERRIEYAYRCLCVMFCTACCTCVFCLHWVVCCMLKQSQY